jgi:hypothetical protein
VANNTKVTIPYDRLRSFLRPDGALAWRSNPVQSLCRDAPNKNIACVTFRLQPDARFGSGNLVSNPDGIAQIMEGVEALNQLRRTSTRDAKATAPVPKLPTWCADRSSLGCYQAFDRARQGRCRCRAGPHHQPSRALVDRWGVLPARNLIVSWAVSSWPVGHYCVALIGSWNRPMIAQWPNSHPAGSGFHHSAIIIH